MSAPGEGAGMRNLWDVVHRLIDGEPMTGDEKKMAHGLVETHLAQHQGIARQLGETTEKAVKAHGHLFGGAAPSAPEPS